MLVDKRVSISIAQAKEAVSKAVSEWGTTSCFKKGGFILTDGSLLDMSLGTDNRVMDHSALARWYDFDESFAPGVSKSVILNPLSILAAKQMGIIRWNNKGRVIGMYRKPTQAQFDTIKKAVLYQTNPSTPVLVDVLSGTEMPNIRKAFMEYKSDIDPDVVVKDISDFYEKNPAPSITEITFSYKILA